jgi:hypothetical protein
MVVAAGKREFWGRVRVSCFWNEVLFLAALEHYSFCEPERIFSSVPV